MNYQLNTPSEIINLSMNSCENKIKLPLGKMILLGIMAGLFIAFGAATSNTAAHSVTNVGLARLVAGVIFPVGLMMIVFLGGELFTGNCLIILNIIDKHVTWSSLIRNLVIVYFTNLIGALIVVVLIYYSGNLNYSDGLLGAYTIKIAVGKLALSPLQCITSGVLCNIIVCLAVLMAISAKDIAGKVWAILFPICAFVVGGFEHCVANMYYIPAGIIATLNPAYVAKAQEVYRLTDAQISGLNVLNSLHSFIPVTIGNMIGGMLLVGTPLYLIYKKI